MFKAFLIDNHDGNMSGAVTELEESRLPQEALEISVEYSTLNYKDGMVINGLGRMVRSYPHIPGVDLAGSVSATSDARFQVGDRVVVTGWRVGESFWGGYATKARVNPDFAIKLPESLSCIHAMALGTAGLTAMLAAMALESAGVDKASPHPLLVTGAAGGVGTIAILALAKLGYHVAASTGRLEETEYLMGLGAKSVIARSEFAEPIGRPLESERFSGAIDNVGGNTLARIIAQLAPNASVASVGMAGGSVFTASVLPFILRGVNLIGIDSVSCPNELRLGAWNRLADLVPFADLEPLTAVYSLEDLPFLANEILAGKIRGRVVIDLHS